MEEKENGIRFLRISVKSVCVRIGTRRKTFRSAGLLAQLDRAPVSGTGGPRFESWIAHHMFLVYKSMDLTGCGAVRLARFLGVEEVAGSNPVIPTMGLFTTVCVMPN